MPINDNKAFVKALERHHGKNLRRYLASRLRHRMSEVPDLAQEVFLRLLRIHQHESIRSPEAYLITVASHVLHQHAMREAARPEELDLAEFQEQLISPQDPTEQSDTQQRITRLEQALSRLSPKARTALILHRRDGHSVEEIGRHLGVSRAMAKKYLAQALAHCRKRLQTVE